MEKVTSKTFYNFRYVSDPHLSPDGSRVAFMVKRVNPSKNGYDSDLYVYENGESRRVTQWGIAGNFLWLDNDTLLFAGARDPRDAKRISDGEPLTVFNSVCLRTGEVGKAFEVPVRSAQLTHLGDNRFIVLGKHDNNVLQPDEEKGAVTTLTEIPYWGEFGLGYTSKMRNRLYLFSSTTGELKPITAPYFEVVKHLYADGKIAIIGSDIREPDAQVIDARGMVVCAGLIDMHVHLREPGFEYKETIETGCRAAAAGGFTGIAPMANTRPVTDSPEQVAFIRQKAEEAGLVRVYPIGAVSKGQKGQELTDAAALREAGAVALSDDGVPVQNANLLRDALILAHRHHLTVLSHCEDADMVGNRAVNEGRVSRQLRLDGRPAIAEELQVMRDAMLAEETGAAVHICHISTAKSVAIVRRYKRKGVQITCETCPQYFTLTEDEILTKGTMARVNPPLRTRADVEGIIEGLKDGTIDAIATDHAPHSAEEKARPLTEAPSGMVGLETALGVTLTALYHTGEMGLSDILRKMTMNPACILRLPHKGRLAIGGDGDLVIFDPEEKWTVDPEKFYSKGRNTPFAGMELKGKVKYTVVGGKIVYQDQPKG